MAILKAETEAPPVEGVEAMAFQMILLKLQSLERTIQAVPSLLKQIVELLEAQQSGETAIAPWEGLYKQGEVPQESVSEEVSARDLLPQPGGWRRAFPKRGKK